MWCYGGRELCEKGGSEWESIVILLMVFVDTYSQLGLKTKWENRMWNISTQGNVAKRFSMIPDFESE